MAESTPEQQVSRRHLLRRGAVAGAAVWASPMVMSSRVAATVGTCLDPDCVHYYVFKLENGACVASIGAAAQGNCANALCGSIPRVAHVVCHATDVRENSHRTEFKFTLPPGFDIRAVGYKKGTGCTTENTTVRFLGFVGACSRQYLITANDGVDWSHLEVLVCGPIPPPLDAPTYPCGNGSVEPECVNLNTASLDELQAIIHIGEARARQIIDLRAQAPFTTVSDIRRVNGIADARLNDIVRQGLACV